MLCLRIVGLRGLWEGGEGLDVEGWWFGYLCWAMWWVLGFLRLCSVPR